MKRLSLLLFALISIYTFSGIGCGGGSPTQNPPGGGGKYITYFQLAGDKDAYVSSIQDYPHNPFWDNVGTGSVNGHQRSYIHFYMPSIPADAKVLEAYINIYEDSLQYPGTAGIDIGTANADWDPTTLTFSNQPNPPGGISTGGTLPPFTQINTWKGSSNVAGLVKPMLDPSQNFGFVIQSSNYYGETVRSFSSVNHMSRTSLDLGQAPRLYIKVETVTPILLADTAKYPLGDTDELSPRLPGDVLVLNMRSGGTAWPSDWNVQMN
ncbi:MAG: DNRLRE domain-containing protein [bacterium]